MHRYDGKLHVSLKIFTNFYPLERRLNVCKGGRGGEEEDDSTSRLSNEKCEGGRGGGAKKRDMSKPKRLWNSINVSEKCIYLIVGSRIQDGNFADLRLSLPGYKFFLNKN